MYVLIAGTDTFQKNFFVVIIAGIIAMLCSDWFSNGSHISLVSEDRCSDHTIKVNHISLWGRGVSST